MQPKDAPPMNSEISTAVGDAAGDAQAPGRQARLAVVLRLLLDHLDAGAVVAVTPAELRLAHRLQGALAAFDVSSRVWSDPLVSGGDAG